MIAKDRLMDWDDVKYFLELAPTGTLTSPARRLNVQHSTVARRVARLERLQGSPLFSRSHEGYVLTRTGRTFLPQAIAVENAIAALNFQRGHSADNLSGTVRVGCPEGFGTYFVSRWVKRLRKLYPEISIDMLVLPRATSLSRSEADIMIHIDRPERGPYKIYKLFDYDLSLYASVGYLADHPEPLKQTELINHHFISYVADMEPSKFLPNASNIPHANEPQFCTTALATQKAAVLAGYGIALLPDYAMADAPEAKRILGHQISFRQTYYMLIPEEMKMIPRVNAVWKFLQKEFSRR